MIDQLVPFHFLNVLSYLKLVFNERLLFHHESMFLLIKSAISVLVANFDCFNLSSSIMPENLLK